MRKNNVFNFLTGMLHGITTAVLVVNLFLCFFTDSGNIVYLLLSAVSFLITKASFDNVKNK